MKGTQNFPVLKLLHSGVINDRGLYWPICKSLICNCDLFQNMAKVNEILPSALERRAFKFIVTYLIRIPSFSLSNYIVQLWLCKLLFR